MKRKKIIGIAIIVFLVIAALFCWFFAKKVHLPWKKAPSSQLATINRQVQPNDETAGWKTHANGDYGYEIKYPNNRFSSLLQSSSNVLSARSLDFAIGPNKKIISGIEFNIVNESKKSLQDVYKEETSAKDYAQSTKEDTAFQGFKAIKYTGIANGGTDNYEGIIFQKGDSVISFYIRYSSSSKDAGELFDKIITTFKATK
jgi:hypothetical protein